MVDKKEELRENLEKAGIIKKDATQEELFQQMSKMLTDDQAQHEEMWGLD